MKSCHLILLAILGLSLALPAAFVPRDQNPGVFEGNDGMADDDDLCVDDLVKPGQREPDLFYPEEMGADDNGDDCEDDAVEGDDGGWENNIFPIAPGVGGIPDMIRDDMPDETDGGDGYEACEEDIEGEEPEEYVNKIPEDDGADDLGGDLVDGGDCYGEDGEFADYVPTIDMFDDIEDNDDIFLAAEQALPDGDVFMDKNTNVNEECEY